MEKLTARQEQIFNLIKSHLEETGYPPTRAEIADILGFRSANAAEEHLRALARKGAIEMIPGASRGIRIPEPENSGLPIVGLVAAGHPILAQENIDHFMDIDPNMFNPTADYLLKVRGMSMKDAGILEGDLLAVHKTTQVRSGQVIVARIEDEVTVKRLKRGKNRNQIELLPENDEFDIIHVDLRDQNFSIEGLSVGVIRVGV